MSIISPLQLLTLPKDTHGDDYVSWAMPRALGTLGEKAVIVDLLTLLKDTHVYWSVHSDIARV